jgi:hypothetical protein
LDRGVAAPRCVPPVILGTRVHESVSIRSTRTGAWGNNLDICHGVIALAATGVSLVLNVVPAYANPSVPSGCQFDQGAGVQTCTTTTITSSTVGPYITNGYVPASTTFGGVTGEEICAVLDPGVYYTEVELHNVSLDVTITTTTTTQRHGLNGKVFQTSTAASPSPIRIDDIHWMAPDSYVACGPYPPALAMT